MATTIVPLSVATPPDLATASSSDPSEAEPSPCDSNGDEPSGGANSAYEQSAVAALLGLAAWPSSPDDESRDDEQQQASAFGDAAEHLWECAAADRGTQAYHSSDELYSPKFRNHLVDYDTPGYPSPKRMRAPKDGAPPPGTSRFRCKFPGCSKLYASTDAVRKHCRKRHLEWLRQIDRYSAHERGTPKPALYCVWGDDEE